jgi:hypothetical protein
MIRFNFHATESALSSWTTSESAVAALKRAVAVSKGVFFSVVAWADTTPFGASRLVQIGHNVAIGRLCVLAAQVGYLPRGT